jgi:hypothetical protein
MYRDVPEATADPRPPMGLNQRLEELSKPLYDALSALEQIEDRLFGSRPRPAESQSGGISDGIAHAVDRAQDLASEIQGLAHRIKDRL